MRWRASKQDLQHPWVKESIVSCKLHDENSNHPYICFQWFRTPVRKCFGVEIGTGAQSYLSVFFGMPSAQERVLSWKDSWYPKGDWRSSGEPDRWWLANDGYGTSISGTCPHQHNSVYVQCTPLTALFPTFDNATKQLSSTANSNCYRTVSAKQCCMMTLDFRSGARDGFMAGCFFWFH